MPRMPVEIDLVDWRHIADDADGNGGTPLQVVQSIWDLGLAAHAELKHRENLDRFVTAGALEAA